MVFCALAIILAGFLTSAAAGVLVLPKKTVRIEEKAFYGDRSLDEVRLPESLEYIGHQAFAKSSVHYLYIPESVTLIEEDAFEDCRNLVCLVPKGSYAQHWCKAHDVPWLNRNHTDAITPVKKNITVKNGATKKIEVHTNPEGAKDSLVWVSSNKKIFTVNQKGEILGRYPGKARLVVSSKDGSLTTRINVTVQANYRAVLFSESTFREGYIRRNRGDVQLMKEMLETVTGPDGGKYTVHTYDDLDADEVYEKIRKHLVKPSRDGDVSMFFFASHGDYKSTSEHLAGRLWCKNKSTWLELPTLAGRLSGIKGKVIVLLESCGPGAALYDFKSNRDLSGYTDDPESAGEIIRAFSASDPGLLVYQPEEISDSEEEDRKLVEQYLREQEDPEETADVKAASRFKTKKFIVMTAAAFRQVSYSIGSDTYNLFPVWLTKGVGLSGDMPADAEYGNHDGLLSVKELYQYVFAHTRHKQTPLVYPEDSSYELFQRAD